MANSCNTRTPQHRHDHGEDHRYDHQQNRQHGSGNTSNRFTSTSSRVMHFHNKTQTLAALVMFLAVLLMSHRVASEEILTTEPPKASESEHVIQPTINPTAEIIANDDGKSMEDSQILSGLSSDIQQPVDVNNDIFSAMMEVNPEIKIAPEFIDSQSGKKTSESTDNLEQSIRNSVKTEIEMEQNLESSPVLEILKDITEPDIRQTLTEDLIEPTVNQNDITPMIVEDTVEGAAKVEITDDHSPQEPLIPIDVVDDFEVVESKSEVEKRKDDPEPVIAISTEKTYNFETTESLSPSVSSASEENTREARNLENERLNESESSESSSSDASEPFNAQPDTSNTEQENTREDRNLENVRLNERESSESSSSDASEPFNALSDTSNVEEGNTREARNLENERLNESESSESSSSSSPPLSESKSFDVSDIDTDSSNYTNDNSTKPLDVRVDALNESEKSESSASPSSESKASDVVESQTDGSSNESENNREARYLNVEALYGSKNETAESLSSSSESNSSENSQESDNGKSVVSGVEENETEFEDSLLPSDKEVEDANIDIKLSNKSAKLEDTEADLSVGETSSELQVAVATTPSTDIAILGAEEHIESLPDDEETLSVVLEESLSSTVPTVEGDSVGNIEQNEEQTSLDIIAAEEEEATVIPEESEHIVIKKVLDVQEIFAEETATTNVPDVNDIEVVGQSDVFVEEPTPKIVEEVSVPEGRLPETGPQSVEDSTKQSTEINSPESVEERQAVVNSDDRNVFGTQDEDLINEMESGIKSIVQESDAESTHIEDKSNQESSPAASKHDINRQQSAPRTRNDDINEETIDNVKEETAKVKEPETQHDGHIVSQIMPSTTESASDLNSESSNNRIEESFYNMNVASTTSAASEVEPISENDINPEIPDEDVDYTKTFKGSRSVNKALIDDDAVATMFEAYPPQDAGQTFNDNLADESSGIGKALPVSTDDGSNRSTIIIILSSGTALLFIVVSVTIFLISFQRQHGTLDIEMQERSCGKDNLDEEDAETFAKLLEVELPPSVAIALEETEECL